MAQAEVFSPAKINLFLAVTGRRNDGFHDLVSLVAPLDFGDEIRLEVCEGQRGVELTCNDLSLPTNEENLAYRAAQIYLDEFASDFSVKIDLVKNIPSGAGLGGGSSNASSVLTGLNRMLGKASRSDLNRLASSLGSDCPLFIEGKPLVMRGRGELLESLPERVLKELEGQRLLLFKPSISVSTPWAYRSLAADPANYMAADEAEGKLGAFLADEEARVESVLYNSFEQPIFGKLVGLASLQRSLQETFGRSMLMSGSGSSCFVMDNGDKTDDVKQLIADALGESALIRETMIAF